MKNSIQLTMSLCIFAFALTAFTAQVADDHSGEAKTGSLPSKEEIIQILNVPDHKDFEPLMTLLDKIDDAKALAKNAWIFEHALQTPDPDRCLRLVTKLLDLGADVNQNLYPETPLAYALGRPASPKYMELIKLLLSRGASVIDAPEDIGLLLRFAIEVAPAEYALEVTKLMLNHGATTNFYNENYCNNSGDNEDSDDEKNSYEKKFSEKRCNMESAAEGAFRAKLPDVFTLLLMRDPEGEKDNIEYFAQIKTKSRRKAEMVRIAKIMWDARQAHETAQRLREAARQLIFDIRDLPDSGKEFCREISIEADHLEKKFGTGMPKWAEVQKIGDRLLISL